MWTQPTTRCEYGTDTVFVEDQFGCELFPVGDAGDVFY